MLVVKLRFEALWSLEAYAGDATSRCSFSRQKEVATARTRWNNLSERQNFRMSRISA